jgi:hypothetical protein
MPEPVKGEGRNTFVSRCIRYIRKNEPGHDNKAIIGKCEGIYDSFEKKSKEK